MKILVTGAAGFIGSHVARATAGTRRRGRRARQPERLLRRRAEERAARAAARASRTFASSSWTWPTAAGIGACSRRDASERVVHLAAQAGVRYSLENPHAYIESNVAGFFNILEGCRHSGVEHLVYASTSSVYGANTQMPFSVAPERRSSADPVRRHQEGQRADGAQLLDPVRPADHRIALLHRLRPVGPAGHGAVPVHQEHSRRQADRRVQPRPTHARLHLHRRHRRGGHRRARPCRRPDAGGNPMRRIRDQPAPYRLYNIGSNRPVELVRYIELLEQSLGQKAQKNLLPLQPGDVPATWADVETWRRTWAIGRPRRSRSACGASSTGTAPTTAPICAASG